MPSVSLQKRKPTPKSDPNFLPIVFTLCIAILLVVYFNKTKSTFDNVEAKVSELGGLATLESSSLNVANNRKVGERSTVTLSPATSYVEIFCLDEEGCNVALDNATGEKGDLLYVGVGSVSQVQVQFSPDGVKKDAKNLEYGWTASFLHNGKYWTTLNL